MRINFVLNRGHELPFADRWGASAGGAAGNLWCQALALLDKTLRRPGMQSLRLLLLLLLRPEPCVLQFSCGASPVQLRPGATICLDLRIHSERGCVITRYCGRAGARAQDSRGHRGAHGERAGRQEAGGGGAPTGD